MRVLLVWLALAAAAFSQKSHPAVTAATVNQWMKELSNWGRWGAEDQLGTINLITPAKRRQAAALVRDGVSVSLAHEVLKEKAPDNSSPFVLRMTATGSNPSAGQFAMDEYTVLYHGWAHTHMDSLCHVFFQGKMYNGFPQSAVTDKGAQKLSVDNFRNGFFTRGILMDLPALKGVAYLEPGTAIYPEDLDAWEKRAGVKISSGDAVLIYTGRWAARAKLGAWDAPSKAAGIHASCARWLKQRDVAILGSDASSDVEPSGIKEYTHPIHMLALNAMGMPILDNLDLEALSKEAVQRKRWEFLLIAAPLRVPGGTGSPLNPIATF